MSFRTTARLVHLFPASSLSTPRAHPTLLARLFSSTAPSFQSSPFRLFVARLPYAVDDTALQTAFEPFSPPPKRVSARVAVDRSTGRSRGFGHVEFEDEEDGRIAQREMDGKEWGDSGMSMVVQVALPPKNAGVREGGGSGYRNVSEPSTTLFMGNLAYGITKEVLQGAVEDALRAAGVRGAAEEVLEVRLPFHRDTMQSKGFGYVEFASLEASKAIYDMYGPRGSSGQMLTINGRGARLDFQAPQNAPRRVGGGAFGGDQDEGLGF